MTIDIDPVFAGVRDEQLVLPDGRTVAWTRCTAPGESLHPVVRMPGTPGSRWMIRADRSGWDARGIDMITTERPGYGRSTRVPGYGFRDHADDVATILDHLGIDRVHVYGISGGGPHVLAFAARHPDRVLAASVVVGLAPMTEDEADSMVGFNQESHRMCVAGDVEGLRKLYEKPGEGFRDDPLAAIRAIMDTAPEADRVVMADPMWQKGFEATARNAMAQGTEAWIDEGLLFNRPWDFDVEDVTTSVTWWHGRADRNCPWPAAERLVQRMPTATLRELTGGHYASYTEDGTILDDLLARG